MARKAISKGKRFDVFRRDQFTCQYCGAQPPHVVLEVDHIDPVANNGSSDINNLITACFDCNRGKRDKLPTSNAPRPDADLLYLQTQQEIAELNRYTEALYLREKQTDRLITIWQELWCQYTEGDECPSASLIKQMLIKYSVDTVGDALQIVSAKIGTGQMNMSGNGWVRYLWGVARNLDEGDS